MVSAKKKELVQNLIKQIKSYPIVGLVNMQNLPAQQLQNMRAMFRKKSVQIVMTRKKLIQLALKDSKLENIDQLTEKIKGMPALILSKDNPFTLYSVIQKNKSQAPAKAGQIAPNDIVVKAGPTSFAPGPIISELGAVGIKTKVDGGKLTITDDVVVAKEGDEITPALADMLKRLDIQPMEVGLDLVAVWENGTIFTAKQLHIDEEEYLQNITQAAQWAMNLAMETAYPTAETMELLLQKASREAKAVALDQDIITDETKDEILAKAESQALSVKDAGNLEVGAAPVKKEPAEEKPVEEEKKEEAPAQEPVAETPKEEPTPQPAEEKPVEEEKKEEAPAEEPVAETPKEEPAPEPAEEKPVEEEKKEEAPAQEPVAEAPKEEPAPEPAEEKPVEEEKKEKPSEEEIKKAMENIPKEEITLDDLREIKKEKEEKQPDFHPKQGDVSTDEAQELLSKLQKEGTLRDTEEK